jgi:hypothetical protein
MAVFYGQDPMMKESGRSAPDEHVAMLKWDASLSILSRIPAEQKHGGQSQRYRHDWSAELALIFILMQSQAGARYVTIDQTGVGSEVIESRGTRGVLSEHRKYRRHGRPRPAAQRIVRAVAVTAPIADPSEGSAVAHSHGHAQAAGSFPVSKRGRRFNFGQLREQGAGRRERKASQQIGAVGQSLLRRARIEKAQLLSRVLNEVLPRLPESTTVARGCVYVQYANVDAQFGNKPTS